MKLPVEGRLSWLPFALIRRAADHVKVSRSAMILLAGSQPLPAESRHGRSRGVGVISPIAASSRNFTPSRAAGFFLKRTRRSIRDAVAGKAMMKALHLDALKAAPFASAKRNGPKRARAPGTVSMQMMQGHHRH
jgi:hypothetical protein